MARKKLIDETDKERAARFGDKLVAMLKAASQDDLDLIDLQIKEVEAQLKGLRSLREVIAERVLNSPKAAIAKVLETPQPVGRPAATDDPHDLEMLRTKVAQLLRFNGPTTTAGVKANLNLNGYEASEVLKDERFACAHKLWSLTSKGDAFVESLRRDRS